MRPFHSAQVLLAGCAAMTITATGTAQTLPRGDAPGRTAAAQASSRAAPPVSLVVLIAIDQFRGDYVDRYAAQYTGAFARIRQRGAFFPKAYHNHANTETAPGHSTMLSGREPAHTGIVSNDRGVPDPVATLVGYAGPGASPQRFIGTTLFDWMKIADPRARALSVSRKDRGAILPIGRAKESVFWWAPGAFTTSRYYSDTLPGWVRVFNDKQGTDAYAGGTWDVLRPAGDYAEPDSMLFEHAGTDFTFPHPLPRSRDDMRLQFAGYPWMDSLTLAFALDGVRAMQLGGRGATDLLSISLSTTDAIGHAYGPDSRELHDHLLRLDRWLATFLDALSAEVPADRIVFALTGDHGVTSFPEYIATVQHKNAGRVSLDGLGRQAGDALLARYDVDFGFDFNSGLMSADTTALRARGVLIDSLAHALASEARKSPGVAMVYTPKSLEAAAPSDTFAMRWRNAIPRDVSWLFAAVTKPHFIWSPGRPIAEHGTLNDQDMSVPIAFWGRGVQPVVSNTRVRTVDIAPTLAAYLGVTPSEPLDGKVIAGVFGSPARASRKGATRR